MKKKIILLFLTLLHSCSDKTPTPVPPSYPVQIGTVSQKDVPVYIETLGHVESITAIELRSRIEGELTGVFFKQGEEVKQGDLLFTIDPLPYQAALQQAQATLEQNQANLTLATEKVKRYQPLVNDEFYSQIDYETLQVNFAATTALVQQNEAQVKSALINLNYCKIYAPINGMMGLLQVDYGNLVTDGGSVLSTLNQMAPIYVTFSVPEFQLPRIQKYNRENKLKVFVAYEDFTEEVFEGELFMVNNQVDKKTGMITLRATFKNDQRELWPGQFVRARLILYTMPKAVVIPYTAIQVSMNGPLVFVVKDDLTVEQRVVKLGQREDDQIVVLEGLKVDEEIVLEGQLNLYQDAHVFIPMDKK